MMEVITNKKELIVKAFVLIAIIIFVATFMVIIYRDLVRGKNEEELKIRMTGLVTIILLGLALGFLSLLLMGST
jgi:hypothetical protein